MWDAYCAALQDCRTVQAEIDHRDETERREAAKGGSGGE